MAWITVEPFPLLVVQRDPVTAAVCQGFVGQPGKSSLKGETGQTARAGRPDGILQIADIRPATVPERNLTRLGSALLRPYRRS
jgi:hypothetical protein